MDQRTRELERAAEDADALLEAAARRLRGGDAAEALALVGAEAGAHACALRAEALAALARFPEAALAARAARRHDSDALGSATLARIAAGLLAAPVAADAHPALRLVPLAWLGEASAGELAVAARAEDPLLRAAAAGHEAHAEGLAQDPDPLVRARAWEGMARALPSEARAGLLAQEVESPLDDGLRRLALAAEPTLAAALAADPLPLVRYLAQGAPSAPEMPREPVPTRLFSAHGRDFQTGAFLALGSSTELRLRVLTEGTLELVDALLGARFPWRVRGRGYGLAKPGDAPTGDLEDRVALLQAAALLPFRLEFGRGHMFDVLEVGGGDEGDGARDLDEVLVRFLASDLTRHPARMEAGPDHPLLYARLLSRYVPGRPAPRDPSDLLAAAEAVYSPTGVAALARFVELAERPRRPRRGSGPQDPFRT
ncbi:MAG: hypothetical protein AB7N76_33985 [Planctomycetota bacterium]